MSDIRYTINFYSDEHIIVKTRQTYQICQESRCLCIIFCMLLHSKFLVQTSFFLTQQNSDSVNMLVGKSNSISAKLDLLLILVLQGFV
jgi:hypothetical protein